MKTFAATAASLLALASSTVAVTPIQMRGADFVDSSSGDRFFIVGVDYQPGGSSGYGTSNSDPLSNGTACLRDAVLMQQLGVNTIRSYNVDPTLNHDECVSIFNEAGIYMILDVNSPLAGQSLDRSNPSGTYTTSYLNHIFSVVEAFKSYPNTLGFFAGNEIINDVPTAKDNPPYIRAITRDLKNYIAQNAPRTIPVGYSAADVREVLQDTWAYLQCTTSSGSGNDSSRSDFFGLNSYSWCGGDATFQSAGYDVLANMFANTTIPVFFSEYGCNAVAPRVFDEVASLYSPQMSALSGGLVYEYSNEGNSYGLVSINSNGSVDLMTDYANLQTQFNKLDVAQLQSGNATAERQSPPQCAASLVSSDGFATNFDIPAPPAGAQQLIANGIANPPTGKIVAVKQTSVQLPVFGTSGARVQNLVLKPVNGSNVPSGVTSDQGQGQGNGGGADASASGTATATATVTASGGASSASATTGAAGAVHAGVQVVVAAVVVGLMAVL